MFTTRIDLKTNNAPARNRLSWHSNVAFNTDENASILPNEARESMDAETDQTDPTYSQINNNKSTSKIFTVSDEHSAFIEMDDDLQRRLSELKDEESRYTKFRRWFIGINWDIIQKVDKEGDIHQSNSLEHIESEVNDLKKEMRNLGSKVDDLKTVMENLISKLIERSSQ